MYDGCTSVVSPTVTQYVSYGSGTKTTLLTGSITGTAAANAIYIANLVRSVAAQTSVSTAMETSSSTLSSGAPTSSTSSSGRNSSSVEPLTNGTTSVPLTSPTTAAVNTIPMPPSSTIAQTTVSSDPASALVTPSNPKQSPDIKHSRLVIGIVSGIGALALIACILCLFFRRQDSRRRKLEAEHEKNHTWIGENATVNPMIFQGTTEMPTKELAQEVEPSDTFELEANKTQEVPKTQSLDNSSFVGSTQSLSSTHGLNLPKSPAYNGILDRHYYIDSPQNSGSVRSSISRYS
ncbi:MAG: hypothetical protein M1814_000851 [Vezdaea aestivalis]|nr:MAG: hypothetical protein M1814_000851 [Vezdaea aestivalis]